MVTDLQRGGQSLENKKEKFISFFKKYDKVSLNKKRKAFSLAEAMVTLLIVSIALAAAAPIISKKAATDGGKYRELEKRIEALEEGGGGLGIPDYRRGIEITETNWTATASGWLKLFRWAPDGSRPRSFQINGNNIASIAAYKYGDGHTIWIPVAQGDVCSNTGSFEVTFYPYR